MPANLLFPFNVSNKDLNNQGRGSINQSPELINQVQGRSENQQTLPSIELVGHLHFRRIVTYTYQNVCG